MPDPDGCWVDIVAPSAGFPHPQVAEQCEPLLSERDFEVTRVRIHNELEHPIILFGLTPCGNSLLTIENMAGDGRYPVVCSDCERMMTGSCACEDCLTAPPVWLEPGAGIWQRWEGFLGIENELPAECGRSGCEGACRRAVQAGAGDYRMSIGVARVDDCTDGEGEPCRCEPGDEGVCVLASDVEFADVDTLVFEREVTLGRACDGVDVTIDGLPAARS